MLMRRQSCSELSTPPPARLLLCMRCSFSSLAPPRKRSAQRTTGTGAASFPSGSFCRAATPRLPRQQTCSASRLLWHAMPASRRAHHVVARTFFPHFRWRVCFTSVPWHGSSSEREPRRSRRPIFTKFSVRCVVCTINRVSLPQPTPCMIVNLFVARCPPGLHAAVGLSRRLHPKCPNPFPLFVGLHLFHAAFTIASHVPVLI